MKREAPRNIVLLILITVLFVIPPVAAQNVPVQQELSAELAALVRNRWEAIKSDTKSLQDEWVGEYRAFDGPTITTHFAWSPSSGFIVWWYNCSRPSSTLVNYGSAALEDSSLKIVPQLSEGTAGIFDMGLEFVPVKWGEQHFLIPSNQMMQFVYAVNSGSVSEIESFLMKTDDYQKKRTGLPGVPQAYSTFLGMKPIRASISGFGPKPERWYPRVILNVGVAQHVIPGMKFYISRRGGHFVVLEVISVHPRSSEAGVILATHKSNGKEIEPKVGWTFSSRAPKDSWRFLP